MDIEGGLISVSDPAAAHISLVGQDQGCRHGIDWNASGLVVIADGGDDGSHLTGLTAHVVQDAPGHDRTGLGMILPVHQIADVVEIPGDFRQLHRSLVIAHSLQNISGSLSHMHYMGEAVLRKAQSAQGFIRPDDVGLDGFTFRDLFISQHIDSSFALILSQILEKERGWGDNLQRFYLKIAFYYLL